MPPRHIVKKPVMQHSNRGESRGQVLGDNAAHFRATTASSSLVHLLCYLVNVQVSSSIISMLVSCDVFSCSASLGFDRSKLVYKFKSPTQQLSDSCHTAVSLHDRFCGKASQKVSGRAQSRGQNRFDDMLFMIYQKRQQATGERSSTRTPTKPTKLKWRKSQPVSMLRKALQSPHPLYFLHHLG